MNYNISVRYIFLSFILFAVSCSEPEKPVTKEEAAKVAASLAQAVARHSDSRFNELLDVDAIEERILDQAGKKVDRQMVTRGMKTLRSGEYGKEIVRNIGNKGSYELVKQYEKDNHQHLIFRLYNDQLNYHDLLLIKKGDKVRIADIFIYTTGENLTTTIAESLRYINEQADASDVPKDILPRVQLIKKHVNTNNFEVADSLFKTLPPILTEQKLYKIMYIQIASGLSSDKYLSALNKLQQEYPDAPNMYLLMIDAYFLKKDFDGAMRSVNSLDSLINKDAFLDYYRALIAKENMDKAQKLVYLERLHKNLPAFDAGTLELIFAYLEDEQWDNAVPLTLQYRKSKKANTEVLDILYGNYPVFKKKVDAAAGAAS
ncbi:lipopolysaccharide assembly protein LapB [Chitinophaga sp. S165]|uniref:tetratricopeptide repeat protein n=1 Tax=Chitinophaga sp. S165 TaxID=2135462 RepID=UPI000D7102AA|nr:hypothetical protein [Chitinophaga sp. S165]PWV46131.1 hypothetical protein C7475_11133 [Chitinophaga sp. S165]